MLAMSSGYQISHARLGIDRSDPDLVAGWEMNQRIAGQVDDVSGHITGLLVGNIQQRHCLLGPYINFNGVDQRVNISGFAEVTTDLSFNFWVRSTSATSSNYLFYSRSTAGGIFDLAIAWSHNGKLAVYDGAWRDFDNTPNDGHWHHIVFILDKTALTAKCYVDTVQSGSTQTYTPQILGTTASLCSNSAGNAGFFDGDLLNTSFCDCVQDTNWVQTQYNRGCLALFKTKSVPTTGTISSGWIGESPFILKAGTADIQRYANGVDSITVVNAPSGDCRFYFPTAITLQTPEESARGFFSWSIYHTYDNNIYIQFIANNTDFLNASGHNGYSLTILSSGVIQLKRSDSGILTTLCETGAGTFPDSIFGTLSVSVDSDGLFIVYVDGVQVCSATDTTYTASAYQVFRLPITGKRLGLGDSHGNYSVVKRFLP